MNDRHVMFLTKIVFILFQSCYSTKFFYIVLTPSASARVL